MHNRFAYIFIGRSGCGKGTQVRGLIDYLQKNNPMIVSGKERVLNTETGEYFREFINQSNYSSTLSKDLMDQALPQPSFLAVWIWARVLVEELTGNEHIVFDGTPRSLIEAEALDTALNFYGFKHRVVVHLDVSRDWAKGRLLSRGRVDDNEADIDRRLDWFETDVKPALDYYADNPNYLYLKVDGEQSIDDVHSAIIGKL